jgi:TP901 family phage tail tape measure protein
MASAGAVRAGQAYVEISADTAKLKSGLDGAKAGLSSFANTLKSIGTTVIGVGIYDALKNLGGSAGAFDAFKNLDEQLKNIQAVANPTADGMRNIADSINAVSISSGTGPAEVAAVFTELQKAGLDTATIMGGAADSVVQFAKVGGVTTVEAATTMADALNVFNKEGLKSVEVVDILSRSADASSVGIAQIAQAFSQSSAVFGASNQKMKDLATAIGILGNAGVKGSDAGTSLKTFMVSLLAPTEKAADTIAELGINTRDAAGEMLPMKSLIAELQSKLGGLDSAGRDAALKNIFGTDALRAGIILLNTGADGFEKFQDKMDGSLSVAEKFKIVMSSVGNRLNALYASIQRIGVAVGKTLEGSFKNIINQMIALGNGLAIIIQNNPEFITQLVKIGAGIVGVTAAIGAAYVAFKVAAIGVAAITAAYSGFLIAINAINAVLVLLPNGVAAFGIVMAATAAAVVIKTNGISESLKFVSTSFDSLKKSGVTAFNGIRDAIVAGNLKLAGEVAMAGLTLAFETGIATINEIWFGFGEYLRKTGVNLDFGLDAAFSSALTAVEQTWSGFVVGLSLVFEVFATHIEKRFVEIAATIARIAASSAPGGIIAAGPLIDAQERQAKSKIDDESAKNILKIGVDAANAFKRSQLDDAQVKVFLADAAQKDQNRRDEENAKIVAAFRKPVSAAADALNKLAEIARKAAEKNTDDEFGTIGLRGGGGSDFTIGKRGPDYLYGGDFEIGLRRDPREIFKSKVTTAGFFNTSALYGQQVGASAVTTQQETLNATKSIAGSTKETAKNTAQIVQNTTFEEGG